MMVEKLLPHFTSPLLLVDAKCKEGKMTSQIATKEKYVAVCKSLMDLQYNLSFSKLQTKDALRQIGMKNMEVWGFDDSSVESWAEEMDVPFKGLLHFVGKSLRRSPSAKWTDVFATHSGANR